MNQQTDGGMNEPTDEWRARQTLTKQEKHVRAHIWMVEYIPIRIPVSTYKYFVSENRIKGELDRLGLGLNQIMMRKKAVKTLAFWHFSPKARTRPGGHD